MARILSNNGMVLGQTVRGMAAWFEERDVTESVWQVRATGLRCTSCREPLTPEMFLTMRKPKGLVMFFCETCRPFVLVD